MARFLDRDFLEALWGADRVLRLAEESGGVADDVITAAIDLAEADALTRLSGRYSVADLEPFATPETTALPLKQQVAALAMGVLSQHHDIVSADITKATGGANSFFAGVGAGVYGIGLPDAPQVDTSEPLFLTSSPVTEMKFDSRHIDGGLDGW